ncbi:hypothetical protein BH23GEM7_BH23GEM7_19780 [soil metagenome]
MDKQIIFNALEDPDVIERAVSRRGAFGSMGKWAAGLAMASMPVALAAMTKEAFAFDHIPDRIVNALNVALVLEYLEAEFYQIGLATSGLIPAQDRAIFEQISKHEDAHVAFLRAVLGAQAARRPQFDFTAGGQFDTFTNYQTFLALSQGFEDTGVRAYKGQAPNLMASDVFLTAALRIHSVEARHASEVRRLRGMYAGQPEQAPFKGWPTLDQVDVPALQPIYGPGMPASMFPSEANVLQLGINTADLAASVGIDNPMEAASEAFDEPLDLRTVLSIAGMFAQR